MLIYTIKKADETYVKKGSVGCMRNGNKLEWLRNMKKLS